MAYPPYETPVADPRSAPPNRRRPGAPDGRIALFGGGVVAALVAILLYRAILPGPAPLTSRDVADSIDQALASQTPGPALSVGAYAAIQPSLVLIQTDDGAGRRPRRIAPGGSSAPASSSTRRATS